MVQKRQYGGNIPYIDMMAKENLWWLVVDVQPLMALDYFCTHTYSPTQSRYFAQ